jgi:hypothetical protein
MFVYVLRPESLCDYEAGEPDENRPVCISM